MSDGAQRLGGVPDSQFERWLRCALADSGAQRDVLVNRPCSSTVAARGPALNAGRSAPPIRWRAGSMNAFSERLLPHRHWCTGANTIRHAFRPASTSQRFWSGSACHSARARGDSVHLSRAQRERFVAARRYACSGANRVKEVCRGTADRQHLGLDRGRKQREQSKGQPEHNADRQDDPAHGHAQHVAADRW